MLLNTNHIEWHFPNDDSDQWDGFNDSGIETFLGQPFDSLGREINQNAIDVPQSENDAVKVKFQLLEVETSSIPHFNEFKEAFSLCRKVSKDERNEGRKAKVFFDNALKILSEKTLKVLQISDYNTIGMKGPAENGTPYYAFMKASGQSKKTSDTASGSYGIGKFAPYAVSGLRTIFVSTVFQGDSDNNWQQLTQGKSILISHNKNGYLKRGVGFFGQKEKCKPIEGISKDLPDWLQRVTKASDITYSKGTTLSILGFNGEDDWHELIAASVAENFFGAILNKKLCVDINGKYLLDHESIYEFFENEDVRNKIINQHNQPEKFDNCKNYLLALNSSSDTFPEESQMRLLGRCRLKILVGDKLPKKVCFLRNGMFITDNLNRLKRFNDFKDFVAVFECLDPKGNELLRAMEPPRHDDFQPQRLPTKEEKKNGEKALLQIAKWIREMLKKRAKDPVSDVTSIDELKDFFGEEGAEGEGKGSEEINPFGGVIIKAKPIKILLRNKSTDTSDFFGDGQTGAGEGGGGSSGKGSGVGKGGKGHSSGGTGGGAVKPFVQLSNVRAILKDDKTRRVSYTPAHTGKISIKVLAAGADVDQDLKIIGSNMGRIEKGFVILDVDAGKRYSHDIKLNKKFSGSLKVVANEI